MIIINKIFSIIIRFFAKCCFKKNILNLKHFYSIAIHNHSNIKPVEQPSILKEILILAEDRKFYSHIGIDILAIIRAIYFNLVGQRQGASTISQQYIRVLTNNYELSFKRKITEIFLALLLNDLFRKNDIINNYLSVAYFGYDIIGIDKAILIMGYSKNNLTIKDAASLIARLKYPQPRFHHKHKHFLINRRTMHLYNLYIKKMKGIKHYSQQLNSSDLIPT
jgi:membrane peptidoglycan carboxypeptidase